MVEEDEEVGGIFDKMRYEKGDITFTKYCHLSNMTICLSLLTTEYNYI